MLDHIVIYVPASRLEEVTNWYLAALAPLGYAKYKDFPGKAVGLGPQKYSVPFWIGAKEGSASEDQQMTTGHVAFRTDNKKTVEAFYEEGIKAGGKCNGKPGLRHMYHDKYYAAFVLDPVGNNIEVVDHGAAH